MLSLEYIEEQLVKPSQDLIEDVKKIDGDIIILGVSGKIGYNLSALLMNALKEVGINKKVYGVARFSEGLSGRKKYEDLGMETIVADFLNEEDLKSLPQVKNVIFMVGYKFGSFGNEAHTWALNTYLPGRVADYYKDSNIIAFSTGCVYPLVDVRQGAPDELFMPEAIGEYAQSCLGRERMFEYFANKNNTPTVIFRLNYAIDVHYGVLIELAETIKNGDAIDLSMGQVNVIWQPDVSEMAIRSLLHTTAPANILNITGPETLSVRWIGERLGELMDLPVKFMGEEAQTALLSNASKSHKLFGYPKTSIMEMLEIVSAWILQDGRLIDKPTHFQEREGKY